MTAIFPHSRLRAVIKVIDTIRIWSGKTVGWVILLAIFVLGWPLEWVPIVLIVIPILLPIVQKAGIDLIWFCTLVAVCLQTAWLSPPVALSAYFLKGVVPDWSLRDIYTGMLQFMWLQVAGLAFVFVFPQLALWLPKVLFLAAAKTACSGAARPGAFACELRGSWCLCAAHGRRENHGARRFAAGEKL